MYTQRRLYKSKNFTEPQSTIILAPDFGVFSKPRIIVDMKDGMEIWNLATNEVQKIKQEKRIHSKTIGQIDLPSSSDSIIPSFVKEEHYFALTYSTG